MTGRSRKKTPRVFIASSVEGLNVANAFQENLDHDVESTVWNQGIFEPSRQALEVLPEQLATFDFAIFVFSPDDTTTIRGVKARTARDNVILELGLAIGELGRLRTYMVMPRGASSMRIPTDLVGLTPVTYRRFRGDADILSACGAACNQIRRSIRKLGVRTDIVTAEQSKMLREVEKAGLTALYSSRRDYGLFRPEAVSIDQYVNSARRSVHFVSINLMSGLPYDGLVDVLRKKLVASKTFTVNISLINPNNAHLMHALAQALDKTAEELRDSITDTLSRLFTFKGSLSKGQQARLVLSTHNVIPFGSAIMLDVKSNKGFIQIETKSYKVPLKDSFAIEVGGPSKLYSSLKKGYLSLIEDADLAI